MRCEIRNSITRSIERSAFCKSPVLAVESFRKNGINVEEVFSCEGTNNIRDSKECLAIYK